MSRKNTKPAKNSIQLMPPIGWKEEQVSRLTHFEPHRLDDIRQDAGATEDLSNKTDAILTSFQRKNDEQIEQLLRELHIDLKDPDVWRKAFFQLARIHHGVSALSTSPPRQKNKNAKKWTYEHDLIFYQMMQVLLQDPIGERAAVRKIAYDKKRWQQFPYQGQDRSSSTSVDASKREMSFWARWIKIIKWAPEPGGFGGEQVFTMGVISTNGLIGAIAWHPTTGRVAAWLGVGFALGEHQIADHLEAGSTALAVYKSPLGWLRAGCEGIVVVRKPFAHIVLRKVPTLIAEDENHGVELRGMFPAGATGPRIVVRASTDADSAVNLVAA